MQCSSNPIANTTLTLTVCIVLMHTMSRLTNCFTTITFFRLAYSCMNQYEESRDAYRKALELDPTNEGFKNNLAIAEDKIRSAAGGGPNDQGMPGMPGMPGMGGGKVAVSLLPP
jgi:hypothetical protein